MPRQDVFRVEGLHISMRCAKEPQWPQTPILISMFSESRVQSADCGMTQDHNGDLRGHQSREEAPLLSEDCHHPRPLVGLARHAVQLRPSGSRALDAARWLRQVLSKLSRVQRHQVPCSFWTSSWRNPFSPDLMWVMWGRKVSPEWEAQEGDTASEDRMDSDDDAASGNSGPQLMIEDAPESEAAS